MDINEENYKKTMQKYEAMQSISMTIEEVIDIFDKGPYAELTLPGEEAYKILGFIKTQKKELDNLQANKWINVQDELPRNGQKCDVFAEGRREPDCEYWKDQGFTLGDDFYIVIKDVTHWMPLPGPPIEYHERKLLSR